MNFLVVLGTRLEAIKIAFVVKGLGARQGWHR